MSDLSLPPPAAPSSKKLPAAPPEAWEPLVRVARFAAKPLERFLHIEAASGIVLLVCAAVALVWKSSSSSALYDKFWGATLGVRIGTFVFERDLTWFVNDVLMVIFFFVVGLEIRREIHHGELSEWRRAALPAVAAVGGMVAPALVYIVFAGAPATSHGWGVPMATDIAFAVGILALLGKRVPPALRVLLLALAVIDDLGAIMVIALFYSSGIAPLGLVVAAAGVGGIFGLQALGVRSKLAYVVPGAIVWGGTYAAGIHPTIAGVIVGLVTPVRAWLGPEGFARGIALELAALGPSAPGEAAKPALSSHDLVGHLRAVDVARREAISPAESLIAALHPWVAFAIMPIFALANAGVALEGLPRQGPSAHVLVGVLAGLLVGKPLGILLFCTAARAVGIARMPTGLTTRHLVVLGCVAGIGFTMSIFVAQLAFSDAKLLAAAKLGVLLGSGLAAVLGLAIGAAFLGRTAGGAAASADEAEASTTE